MLKYKQLTALYIIDKQLHQKETACNYPIKVSLAILLRLGDVEDFIHVWIPLLSGHFSKQ